MWRVLGIGYVRRGTDTGGVLFFVRARGIRDAVMRRYFRRFYGLGFYLAARFVADQRARGRVEIVDVSFV